MLVKKATSADLVEGDLIICPPLLFLLLLLLICSPVMSVDARIIFLLVSIQRSSKRVKQACELSNGRLRANYPAINGSRVLGGAPQPRVAATAHQITTSPSSLRDFSFPFVSCLLIKLTRESLCHQSIPCLPSCLSNR